MGLGNLNNVGDIVFDCTLFSNSIQSGLNAEMHPPLKSQSEIYCGDNVVGDFNSSCGNFDANNFEANNFDANNPRTYGLHLSFNKTLHH